ncbi:MAG: DUF433 domain-containing protein [Tepidiformaceae bacterium]
MGTRVPVKSITDWLTGGYSLDEFLDNFPVGGTRAGDPVPERIRQAPSWSAMTRLLLDEQVPRQFGLLLPGHEVDARGL